MDNDKHLLQPIPRLQFFGWNKTIVFPGGRPNPIRSEMKYWQPDASSPQLQLSLSGWIMSSNSDIMSRCGLTVSLQTEPEPVNYKT